MIRELQQACEAWREAHNALHDDHAMVLMKEGVGKWRKAYWRQVDTLDTCRNMLADFLTEHEYPAIGDALLRLTIRVPMNYRAISQQPLASVSPAQWKPSAFSSCPGAYPYIQLRLNPSGLRQHTFAGFPFTQGDQFEAFMTEVARLDQELREELTAALIAEEQRDT